MENQLMCIFSILIFLYQNCQLNDCISINTGPTIKLITYSESGGHFSEEFIFNQFLTKKVENESSPNQMKLTGQIKGLIKIIK